MRNRTIHNLLILVTFILGTVSSSTSQTIPGSEENIPFLVTFGSQADKSWGDDDFCQVFFFVIPKSQTSPVFIRVFDPGTSGKHDEAKGSFNTKTKFSIYGGNGCISNKDARNTNPVGNYKSGNMLTTKTFSTEYDNAWYSFGPFNPTSGEYASEYGGYVIKIIAQGISGDDGNLYRYCLSTTNSSNKDVQGSNAFTFEYTFRMHDSSSEVSHIYPYIDGEVISIKQGNFDWDYDGDFKIVTNTRLSIPLSKSGDGNWSRSEHKVYSKEKESTFDIQMHKNKSKPAKNNNVSIYVTNQYDVALPFYTVPIGGAPKPKSNIKVVKH